MATVEEVGEKIRASIREARKEGFAIKPHRLRRKTEMACCAVGSAVRDVSPDEPAWHIASWRLDTSHINLIDVARGFDGERNFYEREWYELGRQIRKEVNEGTL